MSVKFHRLSLQQLHDTIHYDHETQDQESTHQELGGLAQICKLHSEKKIQIIDVKITAPIVPTGMDFCASDKSPDLLEPDMNPRTTRA